MAFFIPALMAAGTALVSTAKLGGALAIGAGGLAQGAGRTLGAAASLASTATRVAGGTIGAATGLVKGVGSAVGVDSNEPADQSRSDDQGAKALPPGVKLNKNGVMVQDRGAKGGGQVLPGQFDDGGNLMSLDDRLGSMEAPDRGDAGPVQQILDYVKVIAANTARTSAGVGMMASSMSFGSSQSNIDDEKGGGGMTGESGGGILSKAFGSVGKTLKAVGTSLGKTLKFGIKGLAIGGALYLFISKREEIEKAIGGIFKYFHELYLTIKESDDPIGEIFKEIKKQFKKLGDKLLTMFETFYKETLEPMIKNIFDKLVKKVENFIDSILFGEKGDTAVNKQVDAFFSSGSDIENLIQANKDSGGSGDLGNIVSDLAGNTTTKDSKSNELDGVMRGQTTDSVKRRWASMYNMSRASDWAIQWTGVPFMHAGIANYDLLDSDPERPITFGSKVAIANVLSSKPIVNGEILSQASLTDPNMLSKKLGIRKDMSDTDRAGILANAAEASTAQWLNQNRKSDMQIASGAQQFDTSEAQGLIGEVLEMIAPEYFRQNFGKDTQADIDMLNALSVGQYNAIPFKERTELEMDFYKNANTPGSIFTHDTHLEKLLTPVAEAFSKGASAPIIMDNSSNNSSVTKQGDTIQMPLGIHTTDPTAHAFHEWKYA